MDLKTLLTVVLSETLSNEEYAKLCECLAEIVESQNSRIVVH